LDALIVKVRDGARVRNKAAHIAVGVDMDGIEHVLDLGPADRGREVLGRRLRGLANRGAKDVLIVCC